MQKAEKREAKSLKAVETKIFDFGKDQEPVRVQVIDGEPWFVGKDVCAVLGISKYRSAIASLDDDEKGCPVVVDTLSGKQSFTGVSESGVYHLIFQSRKPKARSFRKWITAEVLPSIRKYGVYRLTPSGESVIDARDVPTNRVELLGRAVKCVEVEGEMWYCLADVSRAVGNKKTCKVKSLNGKTTTCKEGADIRQFGSGVARARIGRAIARKQPQEEGERTVTVRLRGGRNMLRRENGKLVIEMETGDAAFETYTLMHDIVYAVGAIDKELVSNGTDCISSLCQLLAAMLPSEEDMRTIFEARDRK